MKKMTVKKLDELLGDAGIFADQISKTKVYQGESDFIFRRGYFYTHGESARAIAGRIVRALNAHEIPTIILDTEDVHRSFRGGASVATSSHFKVVIRFGDE